MLVAPFPLTWWRHLYGQMSDTVLQIPAFAGMTEWWENDKMTGR